MSFNVKLLAPKEEGGAVCSRCGRKFDQYQLGYFELEMFVPTLGGKIVCHDWYEPSTSDDALKNSCLRTSGQVPREQILAFNGLAKPCLDKMNGLQQEFYLKRVRAAKVAIEHQKAAETSEAQHQAALQASIETALQADIVLLPWRRAVLTKSKVYAEACRELTELTNDKLLKGYHQQSSPRQREVLEQQVPGLADLARKAEEALGEAQRALQSAIERRRQELLTGLSSEESPVEEARPN